ncbi:MAG: manganese efflux pump MntP family protein [Bacteroidaceae bacterium]
MSELEIWFIGLALAIDCFTISIAAGLQARRVKALPMGLMTLSFGIFQAGMTWLGYMGLSLFAHHIEQVDHWIAFALLSYTGCRMIWEGIHADSKPSGSTSMLCTHSILTLSVATSIDALAVGISLACLPQGSLRGIAYTVGVIGICSTVMSIIGLAAGIIAGRKVNWHAEVIGGSVLLIIGIKILIEHLS